MSLSFHLILFNEDGCQESQASHQHEQAEGNLSSKPVQNKKDQKVCRDLYSCRDEEVDVWVATKVRGAEREAVVCAAVDKPVVEQDQ